MTQLIKGKQIKAQTITINGTTGNVVVAGDLPMGANKITTTASSFSTNELVTKAYVDSVAQGLDPKESVVTATVSGPTKAQDEVINLASPGNSIGGYVLSVVGTRVLIKNQTDSKQNGIYNWNGAAVPMTRATDSDGTPASEVTLGNFTFVEKGTNVTTGWVLSSSDATGSIVIPGTNTQVWVQFSGAGSYSADGQGIVLSAGQFSLKLDGQTLSTSTAGLKLSDNLSSDIANTKSGLSTGLSSEASLRTSADTSLSTGLSTGLSSEASLRTSADTSLSTGLTQRVSTDASLSTGLSTEASLRISTDNSLINIIGNVEKNVFESYTIAVSTNAQTVFTNAITIDNDPTYFRMVVDVDSVQVHLNGLVYSFSQFLAGGGVFYGDDTWASDLELPDSFNLYFNSAVAGFALETDDTIIISYRTYGTVSGL